MSEFEEEKSIVEMLTLWMRPALRANCSKPHWKNTPIPDLLKGAHLEMEELEDALDQYDPANKESMIQIYRESADVANFLAMIMDRVREEREKWLAAKSKS